jgi:hypothetical protein
LAHKVIKDPRVFKEQLAHKVFKADKDRKVIRDHKETKVLLAIQVLFQGLKVIQETQVLKAV